MRNKVYDTFDTDSISSTRIELFDRKKVIVEGCYGIKEYSDDIIQINLPRGSLIIVGERLEIVILTGHEITIGGNIISLEFEGNVLW